MRQYQGVLCELFNEGLTMNISRSCKRQCYVNVTCCLLGYEIPTRTNKYSFFPLKRTKFENFLMVGTVHAHKEYQKVERSTTATIIQYQTFDFCNCIHITIVKIQDI